MELQDDPNKLTKSTVSLGDRVSNNRHTIYNTIIALFIVSSLLFTIWGIRSAEHYFIFNLTSIIIGSIFLAAIYLCISLGLNMTYDLIGFANFAHAEYFIVGAYVGVLWSYSYDSDEVQMFHIFIVLIIAFVAAGLVAVLGDVTVFGPLRRKGASNESLMITSIGLGIVIRNVLSVYFGGGSEYFRTPGLKAYKWQSILIGGPKGKGFLLISTNATYSVDYRQILAVILTAIFVGTLFYFLEKTKTGTALRATSNNIDLAESSGIDTEKMIKLTWFIGGGLAGVAGLIFVFRNPVIPFQGFLFLLPAFAVVVLGGVGSLKGSVIASLIIATSQTVSKSYLQGLTTYFEDTGHFRGFISGYDIIIPFVILIGMILIKPTGLYGEEV